MAKVLALRLVRLAATLLAVSFITFMLAASLPGDPINALLPVDAPRDAETIARLEEEFNLNEPVLVRYGIWLGDAVRGDLGESFISDQPVSETILQRVPITAQLAIFAIFLALVMAVPLGVIGAYRQGRVADKSTSAVAQVALSIPNFIVGIFLIWLLSVQINIFPSTGWNRLGDGLFDNIKTAILPSFSLALTQMAIFSRLLRSDMIATLQENFVLSARSKGLKDRYVLFRHALRPSSLSLITIAGINMGALIGGTVVIEQIFALPGLGSRLLNAIYQRDILMVQGITVFIATVYVVINTLVDFIYMAIDPRIRKR